MEDFEVFPYPLVKSVAFEMRFPNLFYLANHIGDFQVKIMKESPESKMLYRRQLLFLGGIDSVGTPPNMEEMQNQGQRPRSAWVADGDEWWDTGEGERGAGGDYRGAAV